VILIISFGIQEDLRFDEEFVLILITLGNMKKVTIEDFVDQKNLVSHIYYLIIALLIVLFAALKQPSALKFTDIVAYFILGLSQIEIFIFAARMIFKDPDTALTRKELTRIVLMRFFIFIVICFLAAFLLTILFEVIIGWLRGINPVKMLSGFFQKEFFSWFKSTITGLSLGALIFLLIQWQEALKREQKLREENLVFQNETLKSQVNPHFLFNSLNTVSALIPVDPGRAEQFIGNLSSVYRYILENGKKDRVPLQSELGLVNRYFDLHRVRDEEKIVLNIDYSDPGSYQILPVSLQILVENAIKHNMSTRENPLYISIYIENQCIVVKNNLNKKATQLRSTGIGLKNLAQRVKLITGRELIIEETSESYTVKVPLLT
jgi:sensor histidine kinase YesM